MKKNTKHRFKHADPEKNITENTGKATTTRKATYTIENYSLIRRDLKKTLLTIMAFVVLVVMAYFLQEKYSWIESLKSFLT